MDFNDSDFNTDTEHTGDSRSPDKSVRWGDGYQQQDNASESSDGKDEDAVLPPDDQRKDKGKLEFEEFMRWKALRSFKSNANGEGRDALYDSLRKASASKPKRRPRRREPKGPPRNSGNQTVVLGDLASIISQKDKGPKFKPTFDPNKQGKLPFVKWQKGVLTFMAANQLYPGTKRYEAFSRRIFYDNVSDDVRETLGYDLELISQCANDVQHLLNAMRRRYTHVEEYTRELNQFRALSMPDGQVHPGSFILKLTTAWHRLQLVRDGVLAAYPNQAPLLRLPTDADRYDMLRNVGLSQECWDAIVRFRNEAPLTFDDLLGALRQLEVHLDQNQNRRRNKTNSRAIAAVQAVVPTLPTSAGNGQPRANNACNYCGIAGHRKAQCRKATRDRQEGWCLLRGCGRRKHKFRDCPNRKRGRGGFSFNRGPGGPPNFRRPGPPPPRNSVGNSGTGGNQGVGHLTHPDRRRQLNQPRVAAITAVESATTATQAPSHDPWATLTPIVATGTPGRIISVGMLHTSTSALDEPLRVNIPTRNCGMLSMVADTGANVCAATRAWANGLKLPTLKRSTGLHVRTANGPVVAKEFVRLELDLNDDSTMTSPTLDVYIFDELPYDALIGRRTIRALGFGLHKATSKGGAFLPDKPEQVVGHSDTAPEDQGRVATQAGEATPGGDAPPGFVAFQPKSQTRGAFSHPDEYFDPNLLLPAKPIVSREDLSHALTPLDAKTPPMSSAEEGASFSLEGREELRKMETKFANIWSKGQFDVGRIDTAPFVIKIKESEVSKPPHHIGQPYRLKPELRDTCFRQLNDMSNGDIIARAPGEWASGVLFVGKKNGEQRMCVDYRELNDRTEKDDFPTPRINESVSRLAKFKYFSIFDLRGGYMHIPLHPDSQKFTRFITPFGAYVAKRLIFGFINAPCHFQEAMERTFAEVRDVEGVCLVIYIDDLIIGTETEERHLHGVRCLFECAARANVKLHREKTRLAVLQVVYLGHVISHGKRHPDEGYRKKLMNLRPPTDKDSLRRLLGMFEWFSRFIPHYADRICSIRPLTKKSISFEWGIEQQGQLDALKGLVEKVTYLFEPMGNGMFVIECDASDYAVGATLYQWQAVNDEKVEDGADTTEALRPCDHYSRTFKGSEGNWHVAEKEIFAIKTSIEHWDHLLHGRHFEVLTDHKNLIYLFNNPSRQRNKRWERWAVSLQQYDFKVVYVKGEENLVADYLSREGPDVLGCAVAEAIDGAKDKGQVMSPTEWIGVGKETLLAAVEPHTVLALRCELTGLITTPGTTLAPVEAAPQLDQRMGHWEPKEDSPAPQPRKGLDDVDERRLAMTRQSHKFKGIFEVKQLLEDQRYDPFIDIIRRELSNGYTGQVQDLPQAMRTDLKHGRYSVDGQTSLVMWTGTDSLTAVIEIPGDLVTEVLGFAHNGTYGNHLGGGGMRKLLSKLCHWTGMSANCKTFAGACLRCQQFNISKGEENQGKFIVTKATGPFDLVAVDIVGPLPPSVGGYRYLLTVQDHFSRFLQCYPMATCGALETACVLLEEWICTFGCMRNLLSDNGTHFVAAVVKILCEMLGIRHIRTTPYHPQGNGALERAHRDLKRFVALRIREAGLDLSDLFDGELAWETGARLFCLVKNTTVHAAHKKTPAEVIFGYALRTPEKIATKLESVITKEFKTGNPAEFVKVLKVAHQIIQGQVKRQEELYDAQRLAKINRDRRDIRFDKGEMVLHKVVGKQGNAAKFEANFEGPYEVIEVLGPKTVRIAPVTHKGDGLTSLGGPTVVANVQKLRRFKEPWKWRPPRRTTKQRTVTTQRTKARGPKQPPAKRRRIRK